METNEIPGMPPPDAPPRRTMTDAQRAAASENLARGRAKRAANIAAGGGRKPRQDAKPRPLGARSSKAKALGRKIGEGITFVAAIVSAKEPFDGAVLAAGAPRLGETYAAVLERHPKMLQILSQLESGGVYGAAAIATLTVALPILGHHNMLPEQLRPLAAMLTPAPAAAWNGAAPSAGGFSAPLG